VTEVSVVKARITTGASVSLRIFWSMVSKSRVASRPGGYREMYLLCG
jgi:hypothetical protein